MSTQFEQVIPSHMSTQFEQEIPRAKEYKNPSVFLSVPLTRMYPKISSKAPTPPRKHRISKASKANALKVLHRMRDRIEAGWTKETEVNKKGYCLIGALRAEAYGEAAVMVADYIIDELRPWAKKHLGKHFYKPLDVIVLYNDAPSRRKKHILNLLDRAIKKLENS